MASHAVMFSDPMEGLPIRGDAGKVTEPPETKLTRVHPTIGNENPSVSDLYAHWNVLSLDAARQRSFGSALTAGIAAVSGVLHDYRQRVWPSKRREATSISSNEPGEIARADWERFSRSLRNNASQRPTVQKVTDEEVRETTDDHSEKAASSDIDYPSMPQAVGARIFSAWAAVAEEGRALGIPLQGTAEYLQTKLDAWGWDEPERYVLEENYASELAQYGTMPKDVGYAWVHSTLAYHDGEDVEMTRQTIRDEMKNWGWNEAAVIVTFREIAEEKLAKNKNEDSITDATPIPVLESSPAPQTAVAPVLEQPSLQSPERVAAVSINGGGGTGTPPPRDRKDREGWRRWVPLGVAGAVILAVFGIVKAYEAPIGSAGPVPTVPSTPNPGTPTVTLGPQVPTTPEDDNGGIHDQDEGPKVQTKLRGAEADKKGDFVRMTSYADRLAARKNGKDFSTPWWIAQQQLDSLNGSAIPTSRQIREFTDQTLKRNGLTWNEARHLHQNQKIRLVSDAAGKLVLATIS